MSDGGFHEAQMNNMEMTSVSVEEEILFVETEQPYCIEFKGAEECGKWHSKSIQTTLKHTFQ